MKLWVDDIRTPPEGWVWAKSYDEAIDALSSFKWGVISLDHDLGENQKTGYDIALWMVEHRRVPEFWYVHSMNPVGRDNIDQLLRRYWERKGWGWSS